MAHAVSTIRALLKDHVGEITLVEIAEKTDLKVSEISMALCYLLRQRYVTRVHVKSNQKLGRKNIWTYTYSTTKLPYVGVKNYYGLS
jgi:hypothetical protein